MIPSQSCAISVEVLTLLPFLGFSFNLLALLFLTHGIPRARTHTIKYFTLSYYNPQTGLYGIGWNDTHLVAFCVILFTLLRASVMEYVLAPFAKSQGVSKRKDITRFSEQAWLLMYYTIFWSLGVVSFGLDSRLARYIANPCSSTSMSTLLIISTCTSYGPAGPLARSRV